MNFKNLRLWVFLFGTIFLIAAFLFQQSTENRKQLQLQSMRSIVLTKQNFLESYRNYHNQLDSYLRRYFYSKISDEDSPANKMVNIFDQDNRFRISHISLVSEEDLKGNVLDERQVSFITTDSTYILEKNYLFSLDEDPQSHTAQEALKRLTETMREEAAFGFSGSWQEAGMSRTFRITHAVDLYSLMKNNLNDDFFDAIYITDSTGNILFPTKDMGLNLFDPGQLRGLAITPEEPTDGEGTRETDRVGNQHFRLNVSSVEQDIFSAGFKLGSQQMYLIGAKDSEHFSQVALRINFNLLSAFIIGLFLILAGIPVISIIKLDTGDILSRAKVYAVGFSLIMLAFIIGFSISYIRHQTGNYQYPDKILKIKSNFYEQIRPFSDILAGSMPHPLSALTNELLIFNPRGMILEMRLDSLRERLDFINPFVSIANRDYVQNLFNNSVPEQREFISAHYSQSTGKLEGVISKRMSGDFGTGLTFKLDSLLTEARKDERFFIFKEDGKIIFNSDRIRIFVSNLEEAVGEKNWTEIKTLMANNRENFSNAALWKIPLYVNGYEYEGILSRMDADRFDQSLWVLFLVDHNLQHSKTSLTAAEASVFFVAYFLLLFLLSFMVALANKQSVYLNMKSFSYSWFGPSPGKRNKFIILNYVLLLDILAFVAVYNSIRMDIFAIFLFSCLFAIHAALCRFILLFPRQHQKMESAGFRFLLPATLLFIFNLYVLLDYLSMGPRDIPLAVTGILIFIVVSCLVIVIREFSSYSTKIINFNLFPLQQQLYKKFSRVWYRVSKVNDAKRIFAISFTLWTILIGFVPGYVIHRSISHHEDFIWDHAQNPGAHHVAGIPADFRRLVSQYEGLRRIFFAEISDQEETQIYDFIAPDQATIQNSFLWRDIYPSGSAKPGPFFNGMQMITILVLLVSLFILVIFLTQRIYLTEYLFTHSRYRLPLTGSTSKKNYVVCVDKQVAFEWICYQFGINNDEVFVYDLIEHPELNDLGQIRFESVLLIQHIHCLKNPFDFTRPFLELVRRHPSKKIFISSGTSIKELLSGPGDHFDKLLLSEVLSEFLSHTVPLNFRTSSFHLPYFHGPLAGMDTEERKLASKLLESPLFTDSKVGTLEHEVNYGPNPRMLSAIITDEISQDPLNEKMSGERFEKCLLAIQRYNKGFFINVWSELNARERKMVYYYSKEGFINYSNRDTLTELIQKGIFTIVPGEEGLVLFSKSFRNFVTLIVSEREKFQFREDERKHGNVANIRTAAFSFIFLSIAIISYYDPSVLNKTSAYVSGIIGLIGTISSFLSKGLANIQWKKKEENA